MQASVCMPAGQPPMPSDFPTAHPRIHANQAGPASTVHHVPPHQPPLFTPTAQQHTHLQPAHTRQSGSALATAGSSEADCCTQVGQQAGRQAAELFRAVGREWGQQADGRQAGRQVR